MGVIMPNTDIDGAEVVAQLILGRLKQESISHEASPLGRVSVSIGIATAAGSRLDQLQALIEAADQALYSAKALGRNQFATHCKE
ncbi:Phytochrome-like protein cph2 [compost metagenome]